MSRVFVRIAAVLLLAFVFINGEDIKRYDQEVTRYALITNPLGAEVRDTVAAGSNRLGHRNIPRGQKLEILGEGKLWLHVRTRDGDGYIQIKDCEIKEGPLNSNPTGWILVAVVLFGTVGVATYLFYTKKGIVQKEDDFV